MLRLKAILQYNYIYIVLFLFALVYSLLANNYDNKSLYDITETKVQGILTSYKIDGDKLSFEIKGKEKLKCTYFIKSEEEKNNLEKLDLGIELLLEGTLSEPNNNTIPNTFNYKKYLKRNKIKYILSVKNFKVINNKTNILYSIKNGIIKHIRTYQSKDYLQAFIIGDKSYMDDEIKQSYQSLGVSHIFAISGMHISLLSTLIITFLKNLKIKENKAYIVVIVFLLFYMFITNFQASIIRSVGLFTLLYINKRISLDIKVINVLLLDISLILFFIPNFLYNVGFLYSSVVSFSLIKYSHLIKGNYLITCLKVSVIAFLFSLPITMLNNYEFNLLTIFNNLLIVPLVSIVLYPLSIITFMLPFLDNVLFTITKSLEFITPYLLTINIIIPKINFIVVIIYYVLLILFFESYKKIFLIFLTLLIISIKLIPLIDQSYNIYFLDVGQGDSILIKKGYECILIDTGGKQEFKKEAWKMKKEFYYTDNTINLIHSLGLSKINTIILTHGDADHAKEITHLLNNINVDSVIINKGELNYLEKQIPSYLISKQYKGKLDFKLLDTDIIYDNENDNSIISLLNAYGKNILFMGDASIKTEKDLIKKYKLKIDLIKLGHHGSKTSSGYDFLKTINVHESIISSGRNNRYNHPNKETIDNLNKLNINYINTQDKGTIHYKISKHNVTTFIYPP